MNQIFSDIQYKTVFKIIACLSELEILLKISKKYKFHFYRKTRKEF